VCLLRGTSPIIYIEFKVNLNADARVRSQVRPCEICGEQSGTGTDFPPSSYIGFSPYQYNSTNTLHSSSSTCWSYQKAKRATPGYLPKSSGLSEECSQWVETYCVCLSVCHPASEVPTQSLKSSQSTGQKIPAFSWNPHVHHRTHNSATCHATS
jgi:hypothetical protein